MPQLLTPKLLLHRPGVYMHYCEGCKTFHSIWTSDDPHPGPKWTYNNNPQAPTFSPSVRNSYNDYLCSDDEFHALSARIRAGEQLTIPHVQVTSCHYFLTDGCINYCSDSPHHLAGQTVPLIDIPQSHLDYLLD